MQSFDTILTNLTQKLATDINLDISTTEGNALWMTYAIFASLLFDAGNEAEVGLNALNPATAQRFELDGLGVLLNTPRPYLYPTQVTFNADQNLLSGLQAGSVIVMPDATSFVTLQDFLNLSVGQTFTAFYSAPLQFIPSEFPAATSVRVVDTDGNIIPNFSATLPVAHPNILLVDGSSLSDGYRNRLQTIYTASGRGLHQSVRQGLLQFTFVQSVRVLVGNLTLPQEVVGNQTYTVNSGELIVLMQLTVIPPVTLVGQYYPLYTLIANVINDKKDLLNTTPPKGTYTNQRTIGVENPNPNQDAIPISFILGFPVSISTTTVFLTPFSDRVPQSGADSVYLQLEAFIKTYINRLKLGETLYLVELAGVIQTFITSLGLGLTITVRKVTVNNGTEEQVPLLTDQYFKTSESFSLVLNYEGV